MADWNDPEARPLLSPAREQDSASPNSTDSKHKPTAVTSVGEGSVSSDDWKPSREVEDDVLPEASTLGRSLSWGSCFILVISRVIGSGIFATPGAIVQAVGSPGLSLLIWFGGTIIAACGLMVSLEYGCMLPRSGGDKVYLEFTYRHPRFLATTLVAIQSVLLYFTASNCVIFSQYVLFALDREDAGPLLRKGLAAALLLAITIIHVVFPKVGIKVQNVLGWLKIGVILFMIFSSVYAIAFKEDTEESRQTRDQLAWHKLWTDSVWNWGVISTSFFKVFYSYAGLDNIANVLNEVKNPVRTLKSVGFTALLTTSAMYFLINVAYFLIVPLSDIKGSGELIAALFFEQIFGKRVGRGILPFAVALSAVGNVMVVAFAMVSNLRNSNSLYLC
jgi:amino acid transporter